MNIIIKKPTEEEIAEAESWSIWAKEKSTFDWSYVDQETCYITSGSAMVTAPGQTVSFKAGDYVIFPKGLKCTWDIMEDIEKYYKFG